MTIEIFRYVLICIGLIVLGFNIAIVVNAAKIVSAVLPWRLFITGKSGLTAYVIVSLHDHLHGPLGWRAPLAGCSMAVTLISLVLLDHAYRRKNGDHLPPERIRI